MAEVARLATAKVIARTGGDDYLGCMSDADIARFRAQAKECQDQADRSIRAVDKKLGCEWRMSGLGSHRTRNGGGPRSFGRRLGRLRLADFFAVT